MPEAASAVVLYYNLPGISPTLNFNGSVLAQIFDGQVTNWNNTPLQSLNPGVVLPSDTIVPVFRTGVTGTTFTFTSFLTVENAYWAARYNKNTTWPSGLPGTGASGDGGVYTTVNSTPYAIGYLDLPYALAQHADTPAVENPSGNFVVGTVNSTESAINDSLTPLPPGAGSWYNFSELDSPGPHDYPIASLTYLVVYQNLSVAYPSYNSTHAQALVDFLDWVVTTGQTDTRGNYFAPLSSSLASHDVSTIGSMTFDGHPVPSCVGFDVKFRELGLPTGTSWSVTTAGANETSTSDQIDFKELNGTYHFSIATADKLYRAAGGTFTVAGANVTEKVKFTLVTYKVTFDEYGVPSGSEWWVNLTNGQSFHTTKTSLSFSEANGTYSFSTATTNKSYKAPSGKFTVDGAKVAKKVRFTDPGTTSITESETPSLARWRPGGSFP